MSAETHVVTGAYGYSGRYITSRLLDQGVSVRTLTNSPDRDHPFGDQVPPHPLSFDDQEVLVEAMEGASVLYNTYWVRFDYSDSETAFTHDRAVANSRTLLEAAEAAGIERVVHVSITNPSLDSDLSYFRGKAEVEEIVKGLNCSYGILRPAVLFGKEDILINNIAWLLRRLPVFGVFGDGEYRLEPIYVDDFAQLAVEQGMSAGNEIIDAIGPDTFTFREMVQTIGDAIGKPRPIIPIPDIVGRGVARLISQFKGDVMLTPDEIEGLKRGLLYTGSDAAGDTNLAEWASDHARELGTDYTSELARRKNREISYDNI
jgi:uncharacterized protein YbjT (DUF2867 family)